MPVSNKSCAGTGCAWLIIASLLPVGAWANDPETAEQNFRPEFGSLLKTEWAYGTTEKISQKQELVFEPEMNIELNNHRKITAIARLRTDAEDRLEPGNPSQDEVSGMSRRWLTGDHSDMELRELYVESEAGEVLFILGKQQIVWGKADGLKVLDIVNPQDFREFILDDFDESRIPLWSVNAEIPVSDSVLQLIWIPDKTYNVLPEPDSLYAFTSTDIVPVAPPGVAVDFRQADKPDRFFADADYGLRLTRFVGGWDLTVNYLYHFNDTPVLFRTLTPGPQHRVTNAVICLVALSVTPLVILCCVVNLVIQQVDIFCLIISMTTMASSRVMNFLMCSDWTGRVSTIPLSVRSYFKAG